MGVPRGQKIEIPIRVGHAEATWIVYETTAPENYDVSGTFTVKGFESKGKGQRVARVVMINVEREAFQVARYNSGHVKHYVAALEREGITPEPIERDIVDILDRRIRGCPKS